MRSLFYARESARKCRTNIEKTTATIFDQVKQYLLDFYEIDIVAVSKDFLAGGRAEVCPAEYCLYYDEQFDSDPDTRLFVILHELGHLELHPRLKRKCLIADPIYGSMYLNDGAAAVARYNKHSREEAEATAFAIEFLCPTKDVFENWQNNPSMDSSAIAQMLGISQVVVRAQLAEALYQIVIGDDKPIEENKEKKEVLYNDSQLNAARYTAGPALVNAGPGTGKTATLVHRIEYLLEEKQVNPEEMLILTFSNDAAEELRQRVAAKFGNEIAANIEISTFHGFGFAFIQYHGHFSGVSVHAKVMEDIGQEELITTILGKVQCGKLLKISDIGLTVKEIVQHITYLKDRLILPEQLAAELISYNNQNQIEQLDLSYEFLNVFHAYEAEKQEQHYLDFADLIILPIQILDKSPELTKIYREKYKWVMVDEYQDVSRAVAMLLQRICDKNNPPWVVGDIRQSIYRFRGAAPENVDGFANDFPEATSFELNINYRSCSAIVHATNQLAELMETEKLEPNNFKERWVKGSNFSDPLGSAITVAIADSDQAEQEGIAAQVKNWIDMGISAGSIAVLARTNINVRNIIITLGSKQIKATTSGIATAEGAAGDLAALVTFTDYFRGSLPRLAVSLGRNQFSKSVINKVIKRILDTVEPEGKFATDDHEQGSQLALEISLLSNYLRKEHFKSDAFMMMCAFLFDGSNYLRRILSLPDGSERSLILSEIITSLAKAAGYRFSHLDVEPINSRKGFAEYFRASLSSNSPALAPPRSYADAVKVMTCHASKGLEFPYVVVAGQTLPSINKGYTWLPASLQLPKEDNSKQADALFFVGVTRGQQSVMISYATSATSGPRSRPRAITPLLNLWQNSCSIERIPLPTKLAEKEIVTIGDVWGGTPMGALSARVLDKASCAISTYLTNYLGVRFPANLKSLYPIFYVTARAAMEHIVYKAHQLGEKVSKEEAQEILIQKWPAKEMAEHPHHVIYFNLALAYVKRFAAVYMPTALDEHLDLSITNPETGLSIRLNLVACYRAKSGKIVAIVFRPESLSENVRNDGLLWSSLKTSQRVPFILLKLQYQNVDPYVFSGEDSTLYHYSWTSRTNDFIKESESVTNHLVALGKNKFEATISDWNCDKCSSRISCPHWMQSIS